MKYTYSDGEEESDSYSTRRSTRNGTPLDNGPTITASGRQVKPRMVGAYGEAMLPDQRREMELSLGESGIEAEDSEDMPTTLPSGRPMRGAAGKPARPSAARSREVFNGNGTDSDEESVAQSSGKEWSGDENEPDNDEESDGDFDEDEVSGDEGIDDDEPETAESLVVKLSYRKPKPTLNGMGQGLSVNGLPVLLPKPQYQPPYHPQHQPPTRPQMPPTTLQRQVNGALAESMDSEDTIIEVAPSSSMDGPDERHLHVRPQHGGGVEPQGQNQKCPPPVATVNANGGSYEVGPGGVPRYAQSGPQAVLPPQVQPQSPPHAQPQIAMQAMDVS
jgi:hypothetical protein